MPTPPPLWIETHDAPAAVFSIALSSGQSATASRAVFHALGFSEGRCDRSAIEVIAADHDRSFDCTLLDQIVNRQAEFRALTVSEPADARGQSLKLDALASEFDPSAQAAILGEEFENKIVRDCDVRSFAGKRCPTKRSATFAEQRTDVGGNESRKIIRILYAPLVGKGTDIVAVIKRDRSHFLQAQHAFDVLRHGVERAFLIRVRIVFS